MNWVPSAFSGLGAYLLVGLVAALESAALVGLLFPGVLGRVSAAVGVGAVVVVGGVAAWRRVRGDDRWSAAAAAIRRSGRGSGRFRAGALRSVSGPVLLVGGLVAAVVMLGALTDVVADGEASRWDQPVQTLVVSHRVAMLDLVMAVFTFAGDAVVVVPTALVVGGVLAWRRRRWTLALAPVSVLVMSGAAVATLKTLVARPRPPAALAHVVETGWAFPSGHTASATALAVVLGVLLTQGRTGLRAALVWVVTIGMAAVVGVSRLYLGVHWPTDVIAGWLLGAACAAAALLVWHLGGNPRRFGFESDERVW